jgi:hypothetical protein
MKFLATTESKPVTGNMALQEAEAEIEERYADKV